MADDRHGLFARPDAPHRVHDLLLVSSFAADDATGQDRTRAEALVAACQECAALVDDLRGIARAIPTIPAPRRSRDYRLTRADADRLRPQGMRGLVAGVAHTRLTRAHPIAAGLTMLGLAGLLVSTITFGTPVAAPSETSTRQQTQDLQVLEAEASNAAGAFPADGVGGVDTQASAAPAAPRTPEPEAAADVDAPAGGRDGVLGSRTVLAIGSGIVLLGGIALFLVASGQRRRLR